MKEDERGRGVEEDLQCAMRQHVERGQRAWRWRITATAGTGSARQIWLPNCKLQNVREKFIFKRKIYNMRCSNMWSVGMQEHVTMLSDEKQAHGAGALTQQQQDQVRTRESWLLDCRM